MPRVVELPNGLRVASFFVHNRPCGPAISTKGRPWSASVAAVAVKLVQRVSSNLGVDEETAKNMVDGVGAAIQDELLAGRGVGIPYVGVLHCIERPRSRKKMAARRAHLIAQRAALVDDLKRGITRGWTQQQQKRRIEVIDRTLKDGLIPFVKNLAVYMPKTLRDVMIFNYPDGGSVVETVRDAVAAKKLAAATKRKRKS